MAVIVRIPTPLRNLTKGKDEVQADGKTVGEVLNELEKNYKGLKERIFDESGNLRRFVNIYVNDEDIRFLNNLNTGIKDGDRISIIPAIAGGAGKKKETAKVYLSYPLSLVKKPIIWECGQKFKVITNIRSASVSETMGLVALELIGMHSEIEKALQWFRKKGVKVEPIEQDIIEG
jgi:molybdopterin synthase sulfur carrier subunit